MPDVIGGIVSGVIYKDFDENSDDVESAAVAVEEQLNDVMSVYVTQEIDWFF